MASSAPYDGRYFNADRLTRLKYEYSTTQRWIDENGLQNCILLSTSVEGGNVWDITLRNFEDNAQLLQLHKQNCKSLDDDLKMVTR